MSATQATSWVEIVADGSDHGTEVFLVIQDKDGNEARFKIPYVAGVQWGHRDSRSSPQATLDLGHVKIRGRVAIRTNETNIEDLLTEIAATNLARDDEPQKFVSGDDRVDAVAYALASMKPSMQRLGSAMDRPRAPGEKDAAVERLGRLLRHDRTGKEDT